MDESKRPNLERLAEEIAWQTRGQHVTSSVLAGIRAGIQMSATACILSDWQREGDFGIADGADRARNNVLALLRDTPALA